MIESLKSYKNRKIEEIKTNFEKEVSEQDRQMQEAVDQMECGGSGDEKLNALRRMIQYKNHYNYMIAERNRKIAKLDAGAGAELIKKQKEREERLIYLLKTAYEKK